MIPKIIHYVWLGGAPLPETLKHCVDSWRRYMPGYQFICWDDGMIKEIDSVFMQEALAEKKWAFAADYIRVYAINKLGGIYLDTDVTVYKSFDDLLDCKAFIGRESSMHVEGRSTVNHLTTCCFGAEKGNPFIKRCLDYYKNRHFVTSQDETLPIALRYDIRTNSSIFCELAKGIGYRAGVLANFRQVCNDGILVVYPSFAFDAITMTKDTYSNHLALGSWRGKAPKVYTYTLYDKIAWRVKAVVEWILNRFNYTMIKLT